jgi:hypothetical protein
VDWTIRYDKNDPDNITMTAAINAGNIPSGTDVSFAYGFDSYVNNNDAASAITSPNIMRDGSYLNGSGKTVTLTTEEVQSLAVMGCINTTNTGAVLAFYPIGRQFDRAYSARYTSAYANTFLGSDIANTFTYDMSTDNGIAVAYSNIPAGASTTIQTGMFFTSTLAGELDYTWMNYNTSVYEKHLTVPMNTPVRFRMAVNNYNAKVLSDIGYRINMPSGLPINGTPTYTGFTSASQTNGTTYYQVAGGVLPASTNGVVLAPVSTAAYGEWTVNESMISTMSNLLPMSGIQPAILTVTTEANFLSAAAVNVARGGSNTYTVKLPTEVTADRNITVNLAYSGTTAAFSSRPASVTIPSGANSATFTVTASSTATNGQSMTITLASTSYSPVIIGATNQATITAVVPILTQPSNQEVCAGSQTTAVNFTGTNIVPAQCSWTATNGAAIGLANSGTGNIAAFTATNAGTSNIVATFTVTPQGGDAKTFTITVLPRPAAPTAGTAPAICSGSTGSVSATPPSGSVVDWYDAGGTLLASGSNTYTTPSALTASTTTITVTYYAESRNSTTGCRSTTRTPVSFTVSPCVVPVNPHLRVRGY